MRQGLQSSLRQSTGPDPSAAARTPASHALLSSTVDRSGHGRRPEAPAAISGADRSLAASVSTPRSQLVVTVPGPAILSEASVSSASERSQPPPVAKRSDLARQQAQQAQASRAPSATRETGASGVKLRSEAKIDERTPVGKRASGQPQGALATPVSGQAGARASRTISVQPQQGESPSQTDRAAVSPRPSSTSDVARELRTELARRSSTNELPLPDGDAGMSQQHSDGGDLDASTDARHGVQPQAGPQASRADEQPQAGPQASRAKLGRADEQPRAKRVPTSDRDNDTRRYQGNTHEPPALAHQQEPVGRRSSTAATASTPGPAAVSEPTQAPTPRAKAGRRISTIRSVKEYIADTEHEVEEHYHQGPAVNITEPTGSAVSREMVWLHKCSAAALDTTLHACGDGAFAFRESEADDSIVELCVVSQGRIHRHQVDLHAPGDVQMVGVRGLPVGLTLGRLVSVLSSPNTFLPAPLRAAVVLCPAAPQYVHVLTEAAAERLLSDLGRSDGLFLLRRMPSPRTGFEYALNVTLGGYMRSHSVGMDHGVCVLDGKHVYLPDMSRPVLSVSELIETLAQAGAPPRPLRSAVLRFDIAPQFLFEHERPTWMHSLLDFADAQRSLAGTPEGYFLVYEASFNTAMLAFSHDGQVLAVPLEMARPGVWLMSDQPCGAFPVLEQIITQLHKRNHGLPLPCVLTQPRQPGPSLRLLYRRARADVRNQVDLFGAVNEGCDFLYARNE
jgi:hypothetical protein